MKLLRTILVLAAAAMAMGHKFDVTPIVSLAIDPKSVPSTRGEVWDLLHSFLKFSGHTSESSVAKHSELFMNAMGAEDDRALGVEGYARLLLGAAFRAGPVLPLDGPQQIHLALGDDQTSMVAMWVTYANYTPSYVRWGPEGSGEDAELANSALAKTSTYTNGSWTGWRGTIYTAVMENLQPGVEYTYIVGSDECGWSERFNFRAPPTSSVDQPVRLLTYGDQGSFMPFGFLVTAQILRDLKHTPADFVMHVGDISYATLHTSIPPIVASSDEWEPLWDVYMRQMEPIAARMPYMVGVGNHENPYNFTAYNHRFRMPAAPSGGNGNFWYSFDYGSVHITSMSTEHDYSPGSPQWEWIRADLARARSPERRGVTPWVFLGAHRPIYSSDTSEWDSHRPGAPLQTSLDPILREFDVDLVLTGHMHCYERTHPVYNGTVMAMPTRDPATGDADVYQSPKAPLFLVQGMAGALIEESWVSPAPSWAAVRHTVYGYSRIHVHNSTHLQYQFMATADGGEPTDEFWIVK
mmetsp:Transcript_26845/g.86318  ORF Transcript_26845/g.86318 Transcript_26845/m.86318 type:complete len:523 (+) Transcript_26845:29-1597(+)